ncbi:hypothetical protein [Streptococcus cuniculipharyngis]|uniref:Uncharacterized protein n=1 Tax=Streptococcus cuniculipharyngis TaxID=1562651 RepID=A0A5C5SBQ4_9STRE|nr:hypothetical protein [Streptococcus cuniculipharyngis]TWS97404.1 hypothetical protein FRX57_05645 [Streptococcus cuniculipharyngis]
MKERSQLKPTLITDHTWPTNHMAIKSLAKVWLFLAGLLLLIIVVSPNLTLLTLPGFLMGLLSLCLAILGWVFLRFS